MKTRLSTLAAILAAGGAQAGTLTCQDWGHRHICDGPGGYHSTEQEWSGRKIGSDNQGRRWTTQHWNGRDITTFEGDQ